MQEKVRVRFAPSPTGLLHLGGIRSALFNWLFAKQNEGTFVLRFEDTDRERYVPEAAEQIKESLKWLGLNWDEGVDVGGDHGPYIQSERLDVYRKYAQELVEKGNMYPCWCSAERLDALRKEAQKAGKPFKYDRHCLSNPSDSKEPHVLRFKIPEYKSIAWDDQVRGHMEFKSEDLDDFVAIKSDGYPTYNFAVVIDDHLMKISHVFRGDEFIPTTPKNLLIYEAFGWEPPQFVHLPQVLGTDKAKLSKRHGAKSVLEYREAGYLPEAVINFLALLGWNNGTEQEIFSRKELTEAFLLERIQKSPAVFDPERLDWVNGLYLRKTELDDLLLLCEPFWPESAERFDPTYKKQALSLVQERLKFLAELPELTEFFFAEPDIKEALKQSKSSSEELKNLLESALNILNKSNFTHDDLEAKLRALAEENQVKTGVLFSAIRLAITGRVAAPGIFETLVVLGKETSLARITKALQVL